MKDIFYVYVHRVKETNKVFYVGKGKGKRIKKDGRNWKWKKVAKHHEILREIIFANLSEQVAFDWEQELIEIYKTHHYTYPDDVYACNLTAGGDGMSGYKFTEEQLAVLKKAQDKPSYKAKLSVSMKKVHSSPEYKAKMKVVQSSSEYIAKQSAAQKLSYTCPARRAKISETTKAAMNRPDVKARQKAAQSTSEYIAKMSAANTGLNNPKAIARLQRIYEKY